MEHGLRSRAHPREPFLSITSEQLWQRLADFLEAVIPVAEEAGVTLAAHPDDPPLPMLRGQPRLVYQPRLYQKLIDLKPSPRNALEFCVGTLAEMTEGNIYEVVDHYSRQGKLAYVHLRNINGKAPQYRETFIDAGDIDALRVLEILHAQTNSMASSFLTILRKWTAVHPGTPAWRLRWAIFAPSCKDMRPVPSFFPPARAACHRSCREPAVRCYPRGA